MRSWILRAALALPLVLPLAVAQEDEEPAELPPVPAGETGPATAAAPVPASTDFGEGLKLLAALGLPNMKDAQWVKPPPEVEEEGSLFSHDYRFREANLKLKGGVWKLAGEPPRYIDFGSAEPIAPSEAGEDGGDEAEGEEGDASKPNLLQKMLRNHAAKNPPKVDEKKPALPADEADAKAIAEALGKEDLRKEIGERQEYSPSPLPGRCLLFAAQLHAAGKTAAANQVAAAVFSLPVDKEKLIDNAVSQLADTAYAAVAKSFFENHDWVKYRDGVKGVLEKYPRGWQDAGGVAILLPLLEKRASGQRPAAPSIEGVELKPEALAAVEQLLEPAAAAEKGADDAALARSHGMDLSEIPAAHRARVIAMLRQQGMGDESGAGPSGLWLLEEEDEDAEPAKDPLSRLAAMKMDGLIALAAVAADETLVPRPQEGDSDRYYGGHQSPEQMARSSYDSLQRPMTRGEIAMEWLEAALPEDDNRGADAATMALAAVEFWKQHRNDTPVKLALFYLAGSDRSKRSEASTFLAGHKDPEAHAAFEKTVLDSGEPAEFAQEVSTYVEQRKTAARPFFDAYSKALHAAMDGVDLQQMDHSGSSYMIRSAGSVDKFLKPLALKVGAVALEELVASAMKSDKAEDMQALAVAMRSTPPADCLKVLAGPAEKAKPERLMMILQVLVQVIYQSREDRPINGEPKNKPDEETLAKWRRLTERTEPLPKLSRNDGYFTSWTEGYGGKTCGDAVTLALELVVYPGSGDALNQYVDVQGGAFETVFPFVRARVEAWSSGKTPAPWPDAEKVSEDRKKEIADQLAAKPAAELPAYAAGLSPDERRVVAETIQSYDEENPAPANVLELRSKVIARRAYNSQLGNDIAILDQLGISEGYVVTPEKIGELGERLAREAKERSGTQVAFFPGPMGIGCIASATRPTGEEAGNLQGNPGRLPSYFQHFENPEAMAMLSSQYGYEFWSVKSGAVAKEDSGQGRSGAEGLKTALERKSGALAYMTLQVLTREDAEKLSKSEQDEDEEEE